MEKKRMQKLAGINEGTAFKNGRFKLQRWDVGQYNYHGAPSSGGNWCESNDVRKLEDLADQMYDAIYYLHKDYDLDEKVEKVLAALIKKAKSL